MLLGYYSFYSVTHNSIRNKTKLPKKSEQYITMPDILFLFFFVYREIIETMVNAYSQKIFQGSKPVFDGRKNLYSREALPIGKDKV